MPDFVDPSLRELRARLVAEYTDGRRQRLFGHLASCFEHCLVRAVAGGDVATRVGAYLMLQAVVVFSGRRRTDLARPLAAVLTRQLDLPGRLAGFLDPDVADVYAHTQTYRAEAWLPPDLGRCDTESLRQLVRTANELLGGLPDELWDAIALSAAGYGARPDRGGALLVIPPATETPSTAGGARPAGWTFPAELALAVPEAFGVLDARAERLWFDEALAAVLGAAPETVFLSDPGDQPELFVTLAAELRRYLPSTRLVGLTTGPPSGAGPLLDELLGGPPYPPLDADPAPRARRPFPLPYRWPLACYRRRATDADVLIPVTGRDGVVLAADLARCRQLGAACRVRLEDGLTELQAEGIAAAFRAPDPPAWSLRLASPAVPWDAARLRAAGLRSVCLDVAVGAVPFDLAAPVAEALAALGLEVQVQIDTTGLAPAEVAAEVRRLAPAAASFTGPHEELTEELLSGQE